MFTKQNEMEDYRVQSTTEIEAKALFCKVPEKHAEL
jgi:hypothetical protein